LKLVHVNQILGSYNEVTFLPESFKRSKPDHICREMVTSTILPDPPPNFSIDNSLADELLKLSFKDRAELEEETHGVRCMAAQETPEVIERALHEFDSHLNTRKENEPTLVLLRNVIRISSLDDAAAKSAKAKCYLNDPDIRLRFLRCELLMVEKAVQRLLNFLQHMARIFGDFVADRPICISDFNAKEETALQNSRNQYLPFRDRSGRRVCAGVGSCNYHLGSILRSKILTYLHWVISADIETQRKGVVFVGWIFDEDEDKNWELMIRPTLQNNDVTPSQSFDALPVRLASFQHYFPQDTPFFRSLAALYAFTMEARHRKFYKVFFGKQMELRYKLSGFGVPVEMLPVSHTGTVKTASHSSWINVQRTQLLNQENCDGIEIVECPRSEDVVFKKGAGSRYHPGNLYFRALVESAADNHQQATKKKKVDITLQIVENIEKINGRFLEWSKPRKIWIVNKDRSKIRAKVASSIKQFNRQKRGSQQLENTMKIGSSVAQSSVYESNEVEGVNAFFMEQAYYAKRRKFLGLCDVRNCKGIINNAEVDNFCFGKSFFPTR